ncbi:hypothetical protein NAI30_10330, partial [Francisella tularensis subsp. holarctica]|nr:hypothetical protein [Francisella tularensis subsp. holarctica]
RHTQVSGKSLSMVFYTGKAVLALNNTTIVVITDRNDLDDQLFDTLAASKNQIYQCYQMNFWQRKEIISIKILL